MRKRRSDLRTALPDALAEILKENTYGGDKSGEGKHRRRTHREMPDVKDLNKLKWEFDGTEEHYPVYITVQMTDGEWVKYQIHREQPAPVISPALEAVANMKRGYPPKRP